MSNNEILERAISKAIDGGWKIIKRPTYVLYVKFGKPTADLINERPEWLHEVIFSHDFAKALWGEEPNDITNGDDDLFKAPWWKYHLAHMVIADDPIEYLGENL